MTKCWSISLHLMLALVVPMSIVHTRTSMAFTFLPSVGCHLRHGIRFSKKADDEEFGISDENENDRTDSTSGPIDPVNNEKNNLDMKTFEARKNKLKLQSQRQQWYQPPNPLLEDPREFVQALLSALSERKTNGAWNGALCLLRSSTPSWRRLLLNSVGAPSDATNDQVAPSLQYALERPNNQFEILTRKLDKTTTMDEDNDLSTSATSTVQKSWHFPSEPVIFEEDDDDVQNENQKGERILENCWIESRLRSPNDDQLLAVVGWSLQRRQIPQEEQGYNNSSNHFDSSNTNNYVSCWLLDGIDWQDFRDEFRPGIGREEWERICG